ncbi:hypothetical protein ACOME3_005578 [Neoechinorhynchus agilis]
MQSKTSASRPCQTQSPFSPCTQTRIQAIRFHGELIRLMVRYRQRNDVLKTEDPDVFEQAIRDHMQTVVTMFSDYPRCGYGHQVSVQSVKQIIKEMQSMNQPYHFVDDLIERLLSVWSPESHTILAKFIEELSADHLLHDLQDEPFKAYKDRRNLTMIAYKDLIKSDGPTSFSSIDRCLDEDIDRETEEDEGGVMVFGNGSPVSDRYSGGGMVVPRSQSRRIFDFVLESDNKGEEEDDRQTTRQLSFERMFNLDSTLMNAASLSDHFDDDDDDDDNDEDNEDDSSSSSSSEGDGDEEMELVFKSGVVENQHDEKSIFDLVDDRDRFKQQAGEEKHGPDSDEGGDGNDEDKR